MSSLVLAVFVLSCFSFADLSYAASTNAELCKYEQETDAINVKIRQARDRYLVQMRALRTEYGQKLQALDPSTKSGRNDLYAQKKQDRAKIVETYHEEHATLRKQIQDARDVMKKARGDRARAGDKQWHIDQ